MPRDDRAQGKGCEYGWIDNAERVTDINCEAARLVFREDRDQLRLVQSGDVAIGYQFRRAHLIILQHVAKRRVDDIQKQRNQREDGNQRGQAEEALPDARAQVTCFQSPVEYGIIHESAHWYTSRKRLLIVRLIRLRISVKTNRVKPIENRLL